MIRAFRTFSKVCSGLAVEVDGEEVFSIITIAVITCRMLSLTFEATDTTALWVKASTFFTDSS